MEERLSALEGRVLSLEVMMRDLIEGFKRMPGTLDEMSVGSALDRMGQELEEEWSK